MSSKILPGLILLFVAAGAFASEPGTEPGTPSLQEVPLIGSACDGCDAAFDGVPARIDSRLVLAGAEQPGAPMTVQGRVLDPTGQPRAGVVLYVHQTDHEGRYPEHEDANRLGRAAQRHGRLRGWVRSDAEGRYTIDTVRPGSYPGTDIPQHIHLQVIEPGCFTYLVDDVLFTDDPKLNRAYRDRFDRRMGGSGVVTPTQVNGHWQVTRTVHLGERIPGYRPCETGLQ